MALPILTRSSASRWISSVWTSRSEQVSQMTSVANETWGLVWWTHGGRSSAAIVGPESRAGTAPVPEEAAFVGIQFAVGTTLRAARPAGLVDVGIELPDTTARRFWLAGERWSTPGPADAEALVDRLVAAGVVVVDPVVAAAMEGEAPTVSPRTLERRFRVATGLTRGAVDRIGRARAAALLLTAGSTGPEVIARLGYYDEPHLARALRRYVGRTAGQLRDRGGGAIALPCPAVSDSALDGVDRLDHTVGVGGGVA